MGCFGDAGFVAEARGEVLVLEELDTGWESVCWKQALAGGEVLGFWGRVAAELCWESAGAS